jgi:lipoprotein-anchoring transpeptidase ErfK/SrfK
MIPAAGETRRGGYIDKAPDVSSLLVEAKSPGRRDSRERHEGGSAEGEDSLVQVSITAEDIKGPFVKQIPKAMKEKATLEKLSYTSPLEEIGERYHANPKLLEALNPGVKFDEEGQQIWVPNIHSLPPQGQAAKIIADKSTKTVSAYDRDNRLLAQYPATIGSQDKPSPSGETKVARIARDPWYTYDPTRVHFKGVSADEPLKIAPGPRNPVGLVWIALATGEGYGIHGAPDPSEISKVSSHGCVRLTNWDALELASMVKNGTPVEFKGNDEEASKNGAHERHANRGDTSRRRRR